VAGVKKITSSTPQGKANLLDCSRAAAADPLPAFFEPGVVGWPEHACVVLHVADQVAHVAHLNTRDTTWRSPRARRIERTAGE